MSTKVLFILKRREDFNPIKHNPKGLSTGLFNSANFMHEMLLGSGVSSAIEVAIDNNCIDRLVTQHKPTHVIIEALWVVPAKFAVLSKLHPTVTWIVRLHSEMPFMAGEGMALDWIGDYADHPQIVLGINAPRMHAEVCEFLQASKGWHAHYCQQRVIYLPNYYPQCYRRKPLDTTKPHVDISCFGAVRPLKNHLVQAVAALKFARSINKKLRFHINSGRIEMKGDPVMHNLRGMFQHLASEGHELVGHEWAPREEFLQICRRMDIGMQCNFSETFNIVSADLISQGIPILGSREIPWSLSPFNATPTETVQIARVLRRIWMWPQVNVILHQKKLTKYTDQTQQIWLNYFGDNNVKKT
jgi:hypothetical protein